MKKILFLIILVQNICFSQSGWIEQVSGTVQNLNSIYFRDMNNGFVVGNAGTLLKTTDGGTTWNPQSIGSTVNLKSISFLDSLNGYIFGLTSTFFKTTDGGISWLNLSDSIKYSFAAISFLDLQNGIAIQSTNRDTANIYRTKDGGLSWNYLSKVANSNYFFVPRDIYYLDENTIVAVGDGAGIAIVYQSLDGGITWFYRFQGGGSSSGSGYNKTQFINSTTGFLLANSGRTSQYYSNIYKTLNGGTNWSIINNNSALPLCRSIFMLDENNGYAVGNDQAYLGFAKPNAIYRTNSGGIYWVKQISNTTKKLNDIYFVELSTGIVIGDSGIVLKTTNGGETEINSKPIYPTNNSTELPLPIEFKWSSVPNTSSYELQVSTNSSLSDSIHFINLTDTSYTVNSLKYASQYFWRVKTISSLGSEYSSEIWSFTTISLPLTFKLYQNYPNPFNPSTTISYQLPVSGNVIIKVYDILGNEVANLVDEYKPAGSYNAEFTINNLSSGIYFYRLQAGPFIETKKMILLK